MADPINLVYGISRWTNSSRASARHINNGKGLPLCQDGRKVFSWAQETGQPTCQKCINLYQPTYKVRFFMIYQHLPPNHPENIAAAYAQWAIDHGLKQIHVWDESELTNKIPCHRMKDKACYFLRNFLRGYDIQIKTISYTDNYA